jgi:hypothetical protein
MSLQPYLHAMGIQTWRLKSKTQATFLLACDETDAMTSAAEHLLSAMLASIDLNKEQMLTSLILKKQMTTLQPRIILILGALTAHQLLNCDMPIEDLRGKIHNFDNITAIVTHHPAHLLKHPKNKREAYQDLCAAYSLLHD